MQLPRPYFFTSERMVGLVDRPQMAPNEGPISDTIYGYHTLWIAEVPFIPTRRDEEHSDKEAANRLAAIWQRQGRFLYDLAQSREHLTTFEIRFVSWPQPYGQSRVGIAFVGKVFHEDWQTSRDLALELWDKFSAVFPREAPFSYPLVPVCEDGERSSQQMYSFAQWYEPLPFELLTEASIVELRKYEDWPTIRDVGGALHARDYIPHPFAPALDDSALSRLFETLARQHEVCVVSITLRPQRLSDREVVILHELLGWHQRVSREGATRDNPLADVLRELKSDIFDSYLGARAKLGCKVYEDLVREHRSLFSVRLQVMGIPRAQSDLVEALGSEAMANIKSDYPSRWTRLEVTPQEFRWARFNAQWLEFARWGISQRIRQVPMLVRLRQLATVTEAVGAFRLPVAPRNGQLAGIEVRDEPFSLPMAQREEGAHFTVGHIQDRGIQTDIPFAFPVERFMGIMHIFGERSKARRGALRTLLQEATDMGIPWVLISDAHTEATAITKELTVEHCLLDTTTPACVGATNLLLPPPGIALATFVDALQRVLAAVYRIEPEAAIALRYLLGEVYERGGWAAQASTGKGSLADLIEKLDEVLQHSEALSDFILMLRTKCILPLRDLAASAGGIMAAAPLSLGSQSVVVEIGAIGSDLSHAILHGCLWAWLALAFSASTTSQHSVRAIVAVEDGHMLFGQGTSAHSSSPAGTLARTLARQGVSTLLIDERPDLLDENVTIGAGMLLLTRNSNAIAAEKATKAIGASPREQARIRRLRAEEAVVLIPGNQPVLITL